MNGLKMVSRKSNESLELLIGSLPFIDWEKYALKGGTAINLFYRSLPRISIDIDLTYRLVLDRDLTLTDINNSMKALSDRINKESDFISMPHKISSGIISKLFVKNKNTGIKIEPNLILRGNVFQDETKHINTGAAKKIHYNQNVSARLMSFEDVYAGKICAALDRQHPRDLFDIKYLLENEGISSKIKDALIVYLCSNNRPVSELLYPNRIDQKEVLELEFAGMTNERFAYSDFENTREALISGINKELTENDKKFLISFSAGSPEWDLLGNNLDILKVQALPGVKWKLLNIQKMSLQKKEIELKNLSMIFESIGYKPRGIDEISVY